MIGTGILSFRRGRYGWYALALLLVSWLIFISQGSARPPGSSTWQAYLLGGISASLMLWLAALGIRRYRYQAESSMQAWVSAHVYLGAALLGVASFHSAGQLGWNVHSLGYALLVLTVASGVLGTLFYLVLPARAAMNRKGKRRSHLFDELDTLNRRCLELAGACSASTELAIHSSITGTAIGGGLREQLFARDRSTLLASDDLADAEAARIQANPGQEQALKYVAARAPRGRSRSEVDALTELVTVIARRQELLGRIRRDIQLQGWLKIWRYLHVPLAIGLVCAVSAHIFVVFLYW